MNGSLITFEGISGMGKTEYFNRLKTIYKDSSNVKFNGEITDGNHKGYAQTIFEILLYFVDNSNRCAWLCAWITFSFLYWHLVNLSERI